MTPQDRNKLRHILFNKQRNCVYCNCSLTANKKHRNKSNFATIEHLTPQSLNGENNIENLALACQLCNSAFRSDKEKFLGIHYKSKINDRSKEELSKITTIVALQSQIIITEKVINLMDNADVLDVIDYLENEIKFQCRPRFFNSLKKIMLEIIGKFDAIMIQIKIIKERMHHMLKDAKNLIENLKPQVQTFKFVWVSIQDNKIQKQFI